MDSDNSSVMRGKTPKKLTVIIAVILVVLTALTAFVWGSQLSSEQAAL